MKTQRMTIPIHFFLALLLEMALALSLGLLRTNELCIKRSIRISQHFYEKHASSF